MKDAGEIFEALWRRRFRLASLTLPQWARLRPDRLLYSSNEDGRTEWYAWDLSTESEWQVTSRPEGTGSALLDPLGEWIWWFDDSRGNEFGVWMQTNFDGSECRAVTLAKAYATGLALGRDLAVASFVCRQRFSVSVIANREQLSTIYESSQAVTVQGLSSDDSLLVIAHSEYGDSRNRALRILTVSGAEVANLWDGATYGLRAGRWSPVPNDSRLIVFHERTGQVRPAIWAPTSDELTEIDVAFPGDCYASWYPDAAALLITHFWRGRSELVRYDIDSGTITRIPTERGVVQEARIRPDGELWYSLTNSSSPSTIHCGSRTRSVDTSVLTSVAYDEVWAGSVHGFLAEPAGEPPYPTVLQVHGGPAGCEADVFSPVVQAWVDHGFAVAMPNFRGSTGYGRSWREAIVGQPGVLELEDIANFHAHLVTSGIADANRSIVVGHSWGGYLALLALSRQPDRWALGIAGAPLADLAAHYHEQLESLKPHWRSLFGGTPDELGAALTVISPIELIPSVSAPVMILAGANDPRCPIGQATRYVARLAALGKSFEFYQYEAGHRSAVVEEAIRQMEVRLDFAARHLGTRRPRTTLTIPGT